MPSISIVPELTGISPEVSIIIVLLPQPLGPRIEMNSPRRAVKDTSSTTWTRFFAFAVELRNVLELDQRIGRLGARRRSRIDWGNGGSRPNARYAFGLPVTPRQPSASALSLEVCDHSRHVSHGAATKALVKYRSGLSTFCMPTYFARTSSARAQSSRAITPIGWPAVAFECRSGNEPFSTGRAVPIRIF